MNVHSTTSPAADRQADPIDDDPFDHLDNVESSILLAGSLVEMVWMAAESLTNATARNALTGQCDAIQDALRRALDARSKAASLLLGRVS